MSNDKTENDVSTTQDVVPALIAALFRANTEIVQPTQGPPVTVLRDPHLRLRRTLTPSSAAKGLKKYNEAQFMIQGSTGKRVPVFFSVLGQSFQMDTYVWGAEEEDAKQRMVTLHGISPGVSRTRWHSLGDKIDKTKMRYVALDWHSIDRTDECQEEFLTMLPKHILSAPSEQEEEEYIQLYPQERQEWAKAFFREVVECCPRSTQQGAEILRAVIENGLGWGFPDKPFILGVKSWSGGVGVAMLSEATGTFRDNIQGAVIMHPAAFLSEKDCQKAVQGIPTLLCWAKDDPMIPYKASSRFLVHNQVKLITYESGGHANFDGTNNLPNFDDEILAWLQEKKQ